nr:MAG TPA: Transcriptional regulator, LysR family GENOMICS, PSI-BIOLOGY, MIDWEST CENTER.6A [Bacteriophage sp.]
MNSQKTIHSRFTIASTSAISEMVGFFISFTSLLIFPPQSGTLERKPERIFLMDDLKFSVLSRIQEAPTPRAELLADESTINSTSKAVKELLGAGFIRQPTGTDSYEITNPGIAALEAEESRRRTERINKINNRIAVATLAVTVISLLLQLLSLVLPGN